MLAIYKWIHMPQVFSRLCTHYIANYSTYVAIVLYGTTDCLKELFPDNYYSMYRRISVCCILFSYMCVMYFTHVYTHGLMPCVFLFLLFVCHTHVMCVSHKCAMRVAFKLWMICTVLLFNV